MNVGIATYKGNLIIASIYKITVVIYSLHTQGIRALAFLFYSYFTHFPIILILADPHEVAY